MTKTTLQDTDLQKIRDIMQTSNCPNETLHRTFIRYCGIDNKGIHFDGWDQDGHSYEVVY